MKFFWQFLLVSFGLICFAEQGMADISVREEKLSLPIRMGSKTEQMETLIVRPVDGEKFPLVLIVNGSAGSTPSKMHADWLASIAHDFAHRGYIAASVVWLGYGHSTGTFVENGGNCSKPTVSKFLDTRGNQLEAALNALHAREDVDPSVTLGLGISIGGASMLDLAGRSNRPLTAVINLSGGVYHSNTVIVPASNCSLYQNDLVRNFTNFGRNNPTPTLWVYAENDPYFGPKLVQRMLAGYRSQGGQVDFAGLPPFEKNGHTLFKSEATVLIKPRLDDFLRRNHLPAMNEDELAPLLSSLTASGRANAELYIKNTTEKALAIADETKVMYWHYGARTIEEARQEVLAYCQKESVKACRVIAENSRLIDGWRDVVLGSSQ
ncbi:hypothetical protein HB779_22515 (plasmid) [Phyllobacterium sp. 628]|nr:hypothetical protein HB779_22515 [Phyllobacterium sp. 628]